MKQTMFSHSSSLSPQAMGRGTARSAVEGPRGASGPSTGFQPVPLPIASQRGGLGA
jgi:hypothetical protein